MATERRLAACLWLGNAAAIVVAVVVYRSTGPICFSTGECDWLRVAYDWQQGWGGVLAAVAAGAAAYLTIRATRQTARIEIAAARYAEELWAINEERKNLQLHLRESKTLAESAKEVHDCLTPFVEKCVEVGIDGADFSRWHWGHSGEGLDRRWEPYVDDEKRRKWEQIEGVARRTRVSVGPKYPEWLRRSNSVFNANGFDLTLLDELDRFCAATDKLTEAGGYIYFSQHTSPKTLVILRGKSVDGIAHAEVLRAELQRRIRTLDAQAKPYEEWFAAQGVIPRSGRGS